MTNFDKAFENTLKHEGFYSKDPDDPGGETCFGISRRYHPEWKAWELIDRYTGTDTQFPNFVINLLRTYAKEFYEAEFWVKCGADRIDNTAIAMFLFDCAVNPGVRPAVKFLQEALNLLNRNEKDYADITVDGFIGANTFDTLESQLKRNGQDRRIVLTMAALRAEYYVKKCRENDVKEEFLFGWLERTFIGKGV